MDVKDLIERLREAAGALDGTALRCCRLRTSWERPPKGRKPWCAAEGAANLWWSLRSCSPRRRPRRSR